MGKLRDIYRQLKRIGQETRYQTFPIIRRKGPEFHVYLGFNSQREAKEWIDWGLRSSYDGGGFLTRGLGSGAPGRPTKAPLPRPAD